MNIVCENEQPQENLDTKIISVKINGEKKKDSDGEVSGGKASEDVETGNSRARLRPKGAPTECGLAINSSSMQANPQDPKECSSESLQQKPAESNCSSTRSSSSLSSSSSKQVSFKNMEIRSYPIILGDNPNCSCGPPIQIDWEPFKRARYSIDEYEAHRKSRRTEEELQLDYWARKKMLRRCTSCTEDEIYERVKEMSIIQKHRRKAARVARVQESIYRKFARLFRRADKGNQDIPQS